MSPLLEEWTPPPSIEQVLAALSAMVGQSMQEVGDVDVGSNLPTVVEPDSSDDMVGTRQQAHIIGTLEAVEAGGFRRRRRAAGCPGAWGICPGRLY